MNKHRGFTLIEVMITVVIVAILAAVAYPAYTDYIQRGKIAEATATLSEMRVKLEQYFQDNRQYTGACAAGTVAPIPTGKYFTYTCPTLTASTFVVRATGITTQGMGGFTYELTQANAKSTPSVPSGWNSSTSCWVIRKDGSC